MSEPAPQPVGRSGSGGRPRAGRPLDVAISSAIVGLVRDCTGRGPTNARTSIHDSTVLVMLEDTLTKGERMLVGKGRQEEVLALRIEFQGVMRADASAIVEGLTGRRVVAMMGADLLEPSLAAEIFVLDGPPDR